MRMQAGEVERTRRADHHRRPAGPGGMGVCPGAPGELEEKAILPALQRTTNGQLPLVGFRQQRPPKIIGRREDWTYVGSDELLLGSGESDQ